MKKYLQSVLIVLCLTSCNRETALPISDLVPAEPLQQSASSIDPDSVLGRMRASSHLKEAQGLPPLPSMAVKPAPTGGYNPWNDETVDATDFDTLTQSINNIISKMPADQGQAFDRSVKYLLFQVPSNPSLARKANGGGVPSDQDILKAAQQLVHGKSPYQIGLDAWNAAQQAQSRVQQATSPDQPSRLAMPNPLQQPNPLD